MHLRLWGGGGGVCLLKVYLFHGIDFSWNLRFEATFEASSVHGLVAHASAVWILLCPAACTAFGTLDLTWTKMIILLGDFPSPWYCSFSGSPSFSLKVRLFTGKSQIIGAWSPPENMLGLSLPENGISLIHNKTRIWTAYVNTAMLLIPLRKTKELN